MVNTILLTCYYCIYLLSFLHLANCHCSLAGHYYSLWPVAIILPARRILCTYYLLFLLFEVFFASFILYPSPYTMVRSQNAGTLTDTDLLPRQILFLTWLEALSIYCLIEKFCQLIELFEFTESLIFWFALQNKLKFEYILWKILVSAYITTTSISLDTAAAPTSYVLELTGLHQCIFNVLYSYVQKECKFTNVQYS